MGEGKEGVGSGCWEHAWCVEREVSVGGRYRQGHGALSSSSSVLCACCASTPVLTPTQPSHPPARPPAHPPAHLPTRLQLLAGRPARGVGPGAAPRHAARAHPRRRLQPAQPAGRAAGRCALAWSVRLFACELQGAWGATGGGGWGRGQEVGKRQQGAVCWFAAQPSADPLALPIHRPPSPLHPPPPAAVAALQQSRSAEGAKVYLHCTAGLGRAPAVAIAALYWFAGMQLDEAYGYLTGIRPCGPNKVRGTVRCGVVRHAAHAVAWLCLWRRMRVCVCAREVMGAAAFGAGACPSPLLPAPCRRRTRSVARPLTCCRAAPRTSLTASPRMPSRR